MPSPTPSAETSSRAAGAQPAELRLQVASWDDVEATIAAQRGKVVVLDLWSTYCPPCIKELPGLAELQRQYPDDVVCLSLNCNFNGTGSPEDERDAIEQLLRGMNADFLHLISSDPDESLYQKIGIASIPVVRVYDRAGQLSQQFDNEREQYGVEGFTYRQHVSPYVASILK